MLITCGVVLNVRVRVLDWQARKAKLVEKADTSVIDEVLAKIFPLVG